MFSASVSIKVPCCLRCLLDHIYCKSLLGVIHYTFNGVSYVTCYMTKVQLIAETVMKTELVLRMYK